MATTLDCILHPFDCGRAAAAGDVNAQSLAEGSRRSAAAAESGAGAEADSAASGVTGLVNATTAPLGQIASASMWITIGIIAASIVILIVFGYIVLKVQGV